MKISFNFDITAGRVCDRFCEIHPPTCKKQNPGFVEPPVQGCFSKNKLTYEGSAMAHKTGIFISTSVV